MAGTPDHPITVTPNPNRVRVTFAGKLIADSKKTLNLVETTYAPVVYVPRADVDMSLLTKTAHNTHCPYKGDASYYTINADGHTSENAIWSYEAPIADMREIAGYVAFYPKRVDAIEQTPA